MSVTTTYTYRQLLDMLDFIEDYDFNASEATEAKWRKIVKQALAAGWVG